MATRFAARVVRGPDHEERRIRAMFAEDELAQEARSVRLVKQDVVAQVDLDLPGLDELLPLAQPSGMEGWPLINTYSYVYVLAYRDEAFPDGAPDSWQVMIDPKYKGRVAIYDDGIGFHPAAQVAGGGTVEERVVYMVHPSGDRTLQVIYRYPAGAPEDTQARLDALMNGVVGELEALPPAAEGATGTAEP